MNSSYIPSHILTVGDHIGGFTMLMAASLLITPLLLTTSANPTTPPSYHEVRAYVTGYNTVPEQTDGTPCVAASGADICGRHDVVACPRRIGLGTVIEIRGTTYVCEDRLAHKFDRRFDVSCDKDMDCPPGVTGWATIHVYGPATASVPAATLHAGIVRAVWRRPMRARLSSAPAMIRTPSSSRPARLAAEASSRKATRFVRHAVNTRSRASRISGG
jgi:hypothetical protein